jgi:spore coat polysaccharide biosynthesis protein SpsF
MTGIIIQARINSTRLPGKAMKMLLGKPLLYYSYKRSTFAKYADKVIIATSTNKSDDIIEKWCIKNNIDYFRGSENDLIDRYYHAASEYRLDRIVRVTSDNPFVMPEILDLGIILNKFYDYDIITAKLNNRTLPYGLGTMCLTYKTLEKAYLLSEKSEEREHVLPYFIRNREKFKFHEFNYPYDYGKVRLSVDYQKDFDIARKLLRLLIDNYGLNFNMNQLIKTINNNRDIILYNK